MAKAILISAQPVNTSTTEWSNSSFSTIITGSGGTTSDDILSSSYQWFFNSASISYGTASTLTLPYVTASMGGQYFVEVWSGSVIGATSSMATLIVNPLIVTQPQSVGPIMEGNTITITSVFSSSIPITYAWYKDGVLVSGQTTNTLTISNASFAGYANSSYLVVGTTNSGSATSNAATITLIPVGAVVPSEMTWNPFIVGTDGSHGAGYQWK